MGVQCAEWCGKDWCLAQGCEMSKQRHLELVQVGPSFDRQLAPLIEQTMRVFAKSDFQGFIEGPCV